MRVCYGPSATIVYPQFTTIPHGLGTPRDDIRRRRRRRRWPAVVPSKGQSAWLCHEGSIELIIYRAMDRLRRCIDL
jgi:hypothetical protein